MMTTCLTHQCFFGLIGFGIDTPLIDLLAQLERINTRFWTPNSEAVDAFTCDWGADNNWLFPPVYLIPRVIRHAQATAAKGTLIVPLLFLNGLDPAPFIAEWLELKKKQGA